MTIREAVTRAIEELGGRATRGQLKAKVLALRPGTKDNTLNDHLTSMAVNAPSRVHHVGNKTNLPRRFRPEMEILFRRGDVFERYSPERHGIWEVRKSADGTITNHLRDEGTISDEVVADPLDAVEALVGVDSAVEAGGAFAAESHLRDYLAQNLGAIEPGLSLYRGDDEVVGVEYAVGVGFIDILAVDKDGTLVVIELKVGKANDAVVAQALRYRNWLEHHHTEGRPVRAVVVAETVTDKVRYAALGLPRFSLFEYEVRFHLRPVEPSPSS